MITYIALANYLTLLKVNLNTVGMSQHQSGTIFGSINTQQLKYS